LRSRPVPSFFRLLADDRSLYELTIPPPPPPPEMLPPSIHILAVLFIFPLPEKTVPPPLMASPPFLLNSRGSTLEGFFSHDNPFFPPFFSALKDAENISFSSTTIGDLQYLIAHFVARHPLFFSVERAVKLFLFERASPPFTLSFFPIIMVIYTAGPSSFLFLFLSLRAQKEVPLAFCWRFFFFPFGRWFFHERGRTGLIGSPFFSPWRGFARLSLSGFLLPPPLFFEQRAAAVGDPFEVWVLR